METKDLLQLVEKFRQSRTYITNEETAKMALIVPFLRLLGYDPNSPREVRAEYAAEFTQGDGKKHPDRMDYAVFNPSGERPLFVVEAKPLGTDLRVKTHQLARYISQLPELHFGVLTDGCTYLFYGDLDSENVMDDAPFFTLCLDDDQTDWSKAAKFLEKFSRESFNADTLLTDAENSRYRQAMVEKIADALRSPADDERFMRWLTDEVYKGKRTTAVMARLGKVAKDAIEPAIYSILGDSFLERLKARMFASQAGRPAPGEDDVEEAEAIDGDGIEVGEGGIVTTEEELEFHKFAQAICNRAGYDAANVLYRDTQNYFNVSYLRPTRWFLRFFGDKRRKFIMTRVATEEAKALVGNFEVREARNGLRVYIEEVAQLWGLEKLVLLSLEELQSGKDSEA